MKQIFKFIVSVLLIAAFPSIETHAASQDEEEITRLNDRYQKEFMLRDLHYKVREQEYQELVKKSNTPAAILQRRKQELDDLQDDLTRFVAQWKAQIAAMKGEKSSQINDIIDNVGNESKESSSEKATLYEKNNPKEEVMLSVSSDGPTKEEALKNALRTAIEQAYGAFVSANTTILNDELVKDEIVTVSNGSIKNYKEISSFKKPDGSGYMMTVNATVSLPHLITYAKNHGSECEFAGNTFGMELKLFKLQKENELKALYNMIPVVQELCRTTMHWELEVSDPVIPEIRERYGDIEFRSYGKTSIDVDIDSDFLSQEMLAGFRNSPQNYCGIIFTVKYRRNGRENEVLKYIYNTLKAIEIPHEMWSKYHNMGFKPGSCDWKWGLSDEVYDLYVRKNEGFLLFNLRNRNEDIEKWSTALQDGIDKVRLNFVINDNSGINSDGCFYELNKIIKADREERDQYKKGECGGKPYYGIENGIPQFMSDPTGYIGYGGEGLFKWLFHTEIGRREPMEARHLTKTSVILPLSEISKYTSFKVVAID